jgi:hypothetical protein
MAARGGMDTLRTALQQRVYMTRASAYRDALKKFYITVSRRHPTGHGEEAGF